MRTLSVWLFTGLVAAIWAIAVHNILPDALGTLLGFLGAFGLGLLASRASDV
jgi:hypothetical protein